MLSRGIILYADIAAFWNLFCRQRTEAQRNTADPSWESTYPASEAGVYILEGGNVTMDLAVPPFAMDPGDDHSTSDGFATAVPSASIPCDSDSGASPGTVVVVNSSNIVITDAPGQLVVGSSIATVVIVEPHESFATRRRLFSPLVTSIPRLRSWLLLLPHEQDVFPLVVLGRMVMWLSPKWEVITGTGRS